VDQIERKADVPAVVYRPQRRAGWLALPSPAPGRPQHRAGATLVIRLPGRNGESPRPARGCL